MNFEEISTDRLIESALIEKDDDERWNYVTTLHKRGSKEVFNAAKVLCESGDAKKIELGTDILGQLGTEKLPFKKETIPILLNLTESKLKLSEGESEISALQSVIFALGRMKDKFGQKKILKFTDHHSEDVRFAVVYGLLTIDKEPETKALIELSNDVDEDVRNWATFGLGSQIEVDNAEIREALFQRLGEKIDDETGDEIRGEALVGLAVRKDERVVEPLIKELNLKSIGILAIEAAREIADSRLCEPLLRIKDWWDVDEELLKEAIENCCKEKD